VVANFVGGEDPSAGELVEVADEDASAAAVFGDAAVGAFDEGGVEQEQNAWQMPGSFSFVISGQTGPSVEDDSPVRVDPPRRSAFLPARPSQKKS
jgi:hypothetical protein